ncbi:MAG TPA: response regulator [Phycisphaerales bacterium]|nr:response regulator [Phycisphaerales bacterium]
MISVLVVDDNDEKRKDVVALVRGIAGSESCEVTEAADVSAAFKALEQSQYDLMVLDLSLPIRKGGKVDSNGGAGLLRSLNSGAGKRPDHIIGLTAYSELQIQFVKEFGDLLWHVIHYDPASVGWREMIESKVIHIVEAKAGRAASGFGLDLAIVTALERPELTAVLELEGSWVVEQVNGDDSIYHRGVFERDGKRLSVVASAAVEMGMPATAAHAMKVCEVYRPRYLAMVGIAAGVKGAPGDLLIADQTWDYGSGKIHQREDGEVTLAPAPVSLPVDPSLKNRFSYFGLDGPTLGRIASRWRGNIAFPRAKTAIGPVASGAAVVAHRPVVDDVIARNRKLVGIEMETFALFLAARMARRPRPLPLSIKGVCDFGDSAKADEYQELAAFMAAQYLYEFSLQMLIGNAK